MVKEVTQIGDYNIRVKRNRWFVMVETLIWDGIVQIRVFEKEN